MFGLFKPKAPLQLPLLEQVAVGQRCVNDLSDQELVDVMHQFQRDGTRRFSFEAWCEAKNVLTDEMHRRRQERCGCLK